MPYTISTRSKVAPETTDNSTLGTATIIRPISFELEITRNMEGAFEENDLPEVKVEGTLHKISADMSKEDYNTFIALVTTNFQEVKFYQISNFKLIISSSLIRV